MEEEFVDEIILINNNYINTVIDIDTAFYSLISIFDKYIHSSDIFNTVNEDIKQYVFIDDIFGLLTPESLDTEIIVGILSFSTPMKNRSQNRNLFIKKSYELISNRLNEDEAKNLLFGF